MYPPPSVQELSRVLIAGKVRRFHTQPNLRQQSVGEHSFGVALWTNYFYDGDAPSHVLMAALTHDLAEYYVGDVPSNTKWGHPEFDKQLDQIEQEAFAKYLPAHRPPLLTSEAEAIVFYSDKLELLYEALHEIRLGNIYAMVIFSRVVECLIPYTQLAPQYSSHKLQEALTWFLSEASQLKNVSNDFENWLKMTSDTLSEQERPTENLGSVAEESVPS